MDQIIENLSPPPSRFKDKILPSPMSVTVQEGFPSAPYLCQPTQVRSVSPPMQTELHYLPGRLWINPSLWDTEDVAHWLHWAQEEYSLHWPKKRCFEMNGRALCLLTKEDFRRRCPSSGDVLYEILQCVKQHKRDVLCNPNSQTVPRPLRTPTHQLPPFQHDSNPPAQEEQPQASDTTPVSLSAELSAIPVTNVSNRREPLKPVGEHSSPPLSLQTHSDVSADVSISPCSPGHEPLNLSGQKAVSPPREGRIPDCRLLWDYVYHLLLDPYYQAYIRWEDHDKQVFRVVDPNGLARLWGNHKSRTNMTYEKMSRALRHYYKLNIIKKEPGQKLLFRFLKTPLEIRARQTKPIECHAQTPPQDVNTLGQRAETRH